MHYVLSMVLLSVFGITMQTCGSSQTASNSELAKQPAVNAIAVNTTVANKPADSHADDEAPRITLADAKKDFDAGNAIFVDTRPIEGFRLEHVKGAINVPLGEFEAKYKKIPTDKKIIAYCS